MSREKSAFVRDWVIRTVPRAGKVEIDPAEVEGRIDEAEAVWSVLARRGHGGPAPIPSPPPSASKAGWDGPPASLSGGNAHPAYAPYRPAGREPTHQELLQDEAHWCRQHMARPADAAIFSLWQSARAKLGLPVLQVAGGQEADND